MKGYKTIDQFNLRECEAFLESAHGSKYEGLVKQRYAKLCEEQHKIVQMKRQKEQQEMNEFAIKPSRRKNGNRVLLIIFLVLAIAAGLLIYSTYLMANAETGTYDNTPEYNTDESNRQQAFNESNPVDYTILFTRKLTEEDLYGLSKEELRIARNEIYARHGYIFKSADLKEYFGSKSWYRPIYNETSSFGLNEYEHYNVDFIKRHE